MNKPSPAQRLLAAAVAVATTFSLVWAVAALGYPESAAPAPLVLACR